MSGAPWRFVVGTTGGPDVLEREDFDPGKPGPGEILIAHEAIGLNFIDTYVRSGLYPAALPTGVGAEAAGHVIAVGEGVMRFMIGDRVTYATQIPGSYATHRILPAASVLALPDSIPCDVAAAITLKGLTAAFLAEDCAKMKHGQIALVHAAAGGVGALLVPWLTDMGVTVIAHSGTPEKAARATAAGAAISLHGDFDTMAQTINEMTGGKGVDVVFDGIGAASWSASLASLAICGLMVSFGNASGPVAPFSVLDLSKGGSLFVTRPTLFHYIRYDADYRRLGDRLFAQLAKGVISADINQRYALSDAADAHRALEARQTIGSTVLIP